MTEIVGTVIPPEGEFLAILVDTLDGNDVITVSPTVQKSVWVDAGEGDDTINVEPTLVFLPDKTDQIGDRNTDTTHDFGTIDGNYSATGLTIDSAVDPNSVENSEVDVYQFSLTTEPADGDTLSIAGLTRLVESADLQISIYLDSALTTLDATGDTASPIDLGALSWTPGPSNTYYVKIVSENSIKTDYSLTWEFASTPDSIEYGFRLSDECILDCQSIPPGNIVRFDVAHTGPGNCGRLV